MPTYAIRYRRDTTANWLAANPILLDGEMGYERTDDGRLLCKMGDGVLAADGTITGTHWLDLPYCSGPAGPSPEFEWFGTSLRFKNPDGTWGEWTDLQGAQGLQGVQGIPGPTGESVPATATTLGGVMIGAGLKIDAEGCLEPNPDGVTTAVNADGLLSALGGNLLLNSDEWITESGEWVAPVTGWYDLLLFAGGNPGRVTIASCGATGGASGAIKTALVYLTAGQEVPVVIGAGGVAGTPDAGGPTGGATSFGDITTAGEFAYFSEYNTAYLANKAYWAIIRAKGQGLGGGTAGSASQASQELRNQAASARGHFGGGGAGVYNPSSGIYAIGNGAQGSVCVRWHDPAKAAGPLPTPALFAARRMTSRAADAPATVNLYDPQTGQGSVWREEDAPAKLSEGLITEAAWLEICAARAAEEYAAWLASPDTAAERVEMLRAARDARLAATDYLVAPDYPLTDAQRTQVTAYRQALRDLPAQPGAPWDGGGEGTPWPEAPDLSQPGGA